MNAADMIEQSVVVNQPLPAVWALVREPGWWINGGEIREHDVRVRGDLAEVRDREYGLFRLRVLAQQAQRSASFGWYSVREAQESGSLPTVITFTLEPLGEEQTRLTVRESGFLSGEMAAAERQTLYEENCRGWAEQLKAAKAHLEQQTP